jgi:eukaryotic-like serine/threonine-protein kinase
MPLGVGTKLGPYEIVSPLGAGGMGEVYRARDAKLGREIAVKVLPAVISEDPGRLHRFEQEARAASGLNHPGIVTIYDIGSAEGVTYIAMELVEGRTLRELLAEGPLSTRKLLEIGTQLADGLAKAHGAGIVHRDLKPENLMVTKDGFVKILDFGLAKLSETPSRHLSALPTAVAPPTEPGTVLGTVGYMSPEQAGGQPLDFRSDQFALGSILYEMAAGKRAFQRKTVAETLTAIIREDPEPIGQLSPRTPAPLRWIIERCLAKDPEERYASTRDLARDLASVRDHLSETSASGGLAAVEPAPRKRRVWLLPAAATLVLGAALALILRGAFEGRPASQVRFQRLTFRRGPVWSARFAPDGQTIIYAASWDGVQKPELYSVRVENPESLRLALPAGQIEAISRTGKMLVLDPLHSIGFAKTGTLSEVPLSGSAPRDLLEDVGSADWAPDGSALAVVRAPQWRYRLEFPVGKVLYETTTGWIRHPRVSPEADAVAFLDHPRFGDDFGSLAIVDRSGKKRNLSGEWESAAGVAWSADGQEVWFSAARTGASRTLYGVTLSGRQRTVATTPGNMVLQDLAPGGRVLFVNHNAMSGILALLPGETKERDLSGLDWSVGPTLSEDEKTLVFTDEGQDAGPGYTVYLRKLDGSPAVRLGEGLAKAISPDGKWVLTLLVRSAPAQFVLLPTGAGETKTFPKDSIDRAAFTAFFPDGKSVLFAGSEPGRPRRSFIQDLAGGPARPITREGVEASALSPDGKSYLARTREGEFFLAPLQGGPSRPIRGLEPTDRPLRWTSDGRALFVRRTVRELPARVYRVDIETGRRELWKEFTPADPAGIWNITPAAISADGQIILFNYFRTLSDLYLAEGMK